MVPPSTRRAKASLAPKRNFINAFSPLPIEQQRLTLLGLFLLATGCTGNGVSFLQRISRFGESSSLQGNRRRYQ
jgi:hypothetical protein